MTHFLCSNAIEVALSKCRSGNIPFQEFVQILLKAKLVVPSGTDVTREMSEFEPLLFNKGRTPMVGCFSERRRIGAYAEIAHISCL